METYPVSEHPSTSQNHGTMGLKAGRHINRHFLSILSYVNHSTPKPSVQMFSRFVCATPHTMYRSIDRMDKIRPSDVPCVKGQSRRRDVCTPTWCCYARHQHQETASVQSRYVDRIIMGQFYDENVMRADGRHVTNVSGTRKQGRLNPRINPSFLGANSKNFHGQMPCILLLFTFDVKRIL